MEKEKQFMNVDEAANYLGVKKQTLYQWKFERKIPFIKVGSLLKFRKSSLDEWLREREVRNK